MEDMNKIEEKMNKIDLSIQSKKEEIKELRLKKYFLNQMKNKIERLSESYLNLIKDDEETEELSDEKKNEIFESDIEKNDEE